MITRLDAATYEFYGAKVICDIPPIIEVNQGSTVEGYVEVNTPELGSTPTVTVTLYKLIVPTYTEPRYLKDGSDLYSTASVFYQDETLSNGNLRIFWRFDSSSLTEVQHGDHYALSFLVNQPETVATAKAVIEIIVKIQNYYKD